MSVAKPILKILNVLRHSREILILGIGVLGYKLRYRYYKSRLKYLGKNVSIEKGAIISRPENVSIGDHSHIDRYAIIEGANGLEIGRYCYVSSFCVIQGGGTLKISDYVTIGSGCKIYSDTHHYTGRGDALPREQQVIRAAPVVIEKNVHIFVNCVVLPGVKIGEAAVIGANSLVNKDIPPWSIAVGSPARVIKERPKIDLPDI